MTNNILLDTDAYKLTHHLQYPQNITKLYSYAEPRVGGQFDTVSYFGLQMILHDHFLVKVTDDMIDEAEKVSALTFGTDQYFNRSTWERVRDLGYFPIRIKSLPEGMEVPNGTVLFTLESTEEWFATSLNALETLLMHVWYPTTIATNSLAIKKALLPLMEKTGDPQNIDFAVNDFGLRGATSLQAGERGGAGHLVHFRGSDNMSAVRKVQEVYDYPGRAGAVWATEHSVATSYGPGAGELDYVNAQLDRAQDDATISIVIDSYDAINFVKNVIGDEQSKQRIIQRPGRVVLRPDSGDPQTVVSEILTILESIFGSTTNEKGYRVLDHNVGVLQGDGMKRETIIALFEHIIADGWSSDNLIVGSGGGLLQEGFTRDTQRFAIKASYGEKGAGNGFNIQKQPKTDPSKNSKAGLLKVIDDNGQIKSVVQDAPGEDLMRVVYENGQYFPENFEAILKRAQI